MASLYDLWKIRKLIFEFVSFEGSAVGGAISAGVITDVNEDPYAFISGNAALRDMSERPGATDVQIFGATAFAFETPQQAVYYCANSDVPNLTWAGLFTVLQMNQIAASSIGAITLHYELEFLADSSARTPASSIPAVAGNLANFTALTETANQAFFCAAGGGSMNVGLTPGFVGSAVINAIVLGGVAAAFFSALKSGESSEPFSITVGRRIWFRLDGTGSNYLFYPSYGAAVGGHDSATDPGSIGSTIRNTATLATGANTPTLTFEQVSFWTVPETAN